MEISTTSALSHGSFLLSIYVCTGKLEWIVHTDPVFDVTPVIGSFKDLVYDPHLPAEQLLSFVDDRMPDVALRPSSDIIASELPEMIASRLLHSVQQSQEPSLREFISCSPRVQFELNILSGINQSMCTLWRGEKEYIGVEFPLLQAVQECRSGAVILFLRYIGCLSFKEPIIFTRLLFVSGRGDKTVSKVEDRLSIPVIYFPCSSNVDINGVVVNGKSRSSQVSTDVVPVHDVCFFAVRQIADKWMFRKRFVEELSRIAAVIEFDAFDFSHIVIGVRLRRGQLCTVCTADIRLTAGFPMSLPLISIYDLLTSTSTVLNASAINCNRDIDCNAEKLAEEYLSLTAQFIAKQAFGE